MRQFGTFQGIGVRIKIAVCLLLTAGCADDSFLNSEPSLSGLACPQVAILETPGELTRFAKGGLGKIAKVLFQAHMDITRATCEIEAGESVLVTTDARLVVIRGPADTTGEAKFSFFYAVLDSQKKVIMRETFPIIAKFDGLNNKIDFDDTVTIEIDLDKGINPASYTVYAGFEMTAEELELNRKRMR